MSEHYVTPVIRYDYIAAVEEPEADDSPDLFYKVWLVGGAVIEVEKKYARHLADRAHRLNGQTTKRLIRAGHKTLSA